MSYWELRNEPGADCSGTAPLVRDAFALVAKVEGKKMTFPNDETPSGLGKGFQNSYQNSKCNFTALKRFLGTENPRHLRAIFGLLKRPRAREEIDSIAGCANGPELIAALRRLGLGHEHLPCERIRFIDRDGKVCRPGVYSFTAKGRRMIYRWLARRKAGPNG